jgi:hypothetical protein
MTDLKLAFGATRSIPKGVTTAWGARLIWPNDLLHDRQDLVGPKADDLKGWLNGGALRLALDKAAELGRGFDLSPRDDRTVVLHHDDRGVIVGNPQGSGGYFYVAAWLEGDGHAAV